MPVLEVLFLGFGRHRLEVQRHGDASLSARATGMPVIRRPGSTGV